MNQPSTPVRFKSDVIVLMQFHFLPQPYVHHFVVVWFYFNNNSVLCSSIPRELWPIDFLSSQTNQQHQQKGTMHILSFFSSSQNIIIPSHMKRDRILFFLFFGLKQRIISRTGECIVLRLQLFHVLFLWSVRVHSPRTKNLPSTAKK